MTNIDRIFETALNEGDRMGIEFMEVRWGLYRYQELSARDDTMTSIVDNTSEGASVRVFHRGVWGFASSPVRNDEDIIKLVHRAFSAAATSARIAGKPLVLTDIKPYKHKWSSPYKVDPFSVDLKEKAGLLLEINGILSGFEGIAEANSYMYFNRMDKYYANSIGSRIDQTILHSIADYTATAVGNDRSETREFQSMVRSEGYEAINEKLLIDSAPRVAKEAIDQLSAPEWDKEKADLILLPNHTRLVIHETIGHATELDRVMGWEADYAGTSFATLEKLNNYRYGSEIFNVTADRTQEHGMASCAFDDEGNPTRSWKIINNGILCGYSTTRDTAPLIGENISNGCAYADNWSSYPLLRMANIGIDPGPSNAPTLSQLIEDTKDGILVDGLAAFSIDHQRINFQFSGDYCRRVKNGRIQGPLWNVVYEGSNPLFWNSMDAVCCPGEWKQYGLSGCAKGQPVQDASLTHGSAPLRLKDIKIRRNQ